MSYLTKDYEISVWEDEWSGTTGFTEKKLAVIGSNTMTSQARVFSPQFVKNTNGTKTLTFKLYKKFIDNVTGEKVHNPFYDYLIAERKVKLKYKGEWHDFLVKSITENSADYLYTYQMEDAFVHELSRNGFDVVFDEKINNNIGTARELGRAALQGTDWTVESDLIIQTSEESLVYVQLPDIGTMTEAIKILDSANMTETDADFVPGLTVLAFYSSCTSKPRRFQFIYSNAHGTIDSPYPKNSDRVITLADCQYYIDMSPDDYEQVEGTNFYLPKNWTLKTGIGASTGDSTPVSHLYRGARYNYGQRGYYHPGLDRYVTEWVDSLGNGDIFSYTKMEYKSPTFIKNYAVNSDLEHGSSGWYSADGSGKAKALSGTMGDFSGPNGSFKSASDMDLTEFSDATKLNNLKSYLKVDGQTFYNTGLTDNRNTLDFTPDDRLVVTGEFYNQYGVLLDYSTVAQPVLGVYACELVEAEISSENIWQNITNSGISFYLPSADSDGIYFKPTSFTQEKLKNSRFKLKFSGTNRIYYARNIQIFKEVRDKAGRLIKPESQASSLDSSEIVSAKEVYFKGADQTNGLNTTEEELILIPKQNGFKPRYRSKAEKAHAINAKESNYFNILQTIAETFGVWLKINVAHDSEGRVTSKGVRFVNYIGKENYAGFRYGVNLKGIQRTQESKNIVTKLIVKPNNNQYGKNGFCTIARAAGNETGETSIYNFQYYYNCGLLNEATITDYLYNATNEEVSSSNARNYYGRLSKLNSEIRQWEEERNGIRLELVSLGADRYSQETIRDSAQSEMGDIARRFRVNYENEEISDLPSSTKFASSKTAKEMYFEWAKLQKVYLDALYKVGALGIDITNRETRVKELEENIERNKQAKNTLHLAFYTEFYRFIREGTWMSEDYLDDDKYYIDAQSTLYNSCFPKAAYQIDVTSLSGVEGYEGYEFEIGDETKVYDPEFFGTDEGIVIAVTETVENLDDPTQASIKVQNFKNEFQDLFQKITATVQQTQYSTGAYHKAVEFVEADESTKLDFLGDAFNSDTATLSIGGQATVVQDASGISIIDKIDPYNALRLLGGKIMISRRDEQGNRYWATGMSSRGISADLITAGTINTGVLNIMSGDDPAFRWDAKGISAYAKTETGYDRTKFTRFDRFGFYGINNQTISGEDWAPKTTEEISENASFYLTWDGLKAFKGEISGFKIGKFYFYGYENQAKDTFYYNTNPNAGTSYNNSSKMIICPGGTPAVLFGEEEAKLWSILSGAYFGVTADGVLYAKNAILQGGTIAGLKISNDKLYAGDLSTDKTNRIFLYEMLSPVFPGEDETGHSFCTLGCSGLKIGWVVEQLGWQEGGWDRWNCSAINYGSDAMWGLDFTKAGKVTNTDEELEQEILDNMDILVESTDYIGASWYFSGYSWFCNNEVEWRSKQGTNGESLIRMGGRDDDITIWGNGLRLEFFGTSFGENSNTLKLSTNANDYNTIPRATLDMDQGQIINTSSRTKKKDIESLDSSYEAFFDLLKPCRFHYTNLSNPKYNIGFIFEEVVEGLEQSCLTLDDFSGCVKKGETGSLSYTEFIALNTDQIQKLKPRMTAAEQEIVALKQEIAELKSQLQRLQ